MSSFTYHMQYGDRSTTHEVFVMKAVTWYYISLQACKDLGLVHADFPHQSPVATLIVTDVGNGADSTSKRPPMIPFPPLEEYVPQLEEWLFRHFSRFTSSDGRRAAYHLSAPRHQTICLLHAGFGTETLGGRGEDTAWRGYQEGDPGASTSGRGNGVVCKNGDGLLGRSRQAVYWLSMEGDRQHHKNACVTCNINFPLTPTSPPWYPFQHTVVDLFQFEGQMYLAYDDRITGWLEVAYFPSGATLSRLASVFCLSRQWDKPN